MRWCQHVWTERARARVCQRGFSRCFPMVRSLAVEAAVQRFRHFLEFWTTYKCDRASQRCRRSYSGRVVLSVSWLSWGTSVCVCGGHWH